MDRETTDIDAVVALQTEVEGWRPHRVPDLVELTGRPGSGWQRPVMLASALGATALALVLALSVAVVTLAPSNIGWAMVVKDHLTAMP